MGVQSKAWNTLVNILKGDPGLNRVKCWRVWDGSKNDGAEITEKELPAIRLTPRPMRTRRLDTCTDRLTIQVRVEAHLPGGRITDGMDFSEVFDNALRTERAGAMLADAGVFDVEHEILCFGVVNQGGLRLIGEGQIRIEIDIPSQT